MARALVVYESMFGNTEQVARAIAAGVGESMPVDLAEVTYAPTCLDDHAVVLVGGPTHASGMSRDATRREARERGAPHGSVGRGQREWLCELPVRGPRPWFATFDTRVSRGRHLPRSAARGAARSARRQGLRDLVAPESFFVEAVDGPLVSGELERARNWGTAVASAYDARRVGGEVRGARGARHRGRDPRLA